MKKICILMLLSCSGASSVLLNAHAAESCNLPACTCPAPASSDLFNLSLCVEGKTASVGANSLSGILAQINEAQMAQQFSTYENGVSAAVYHLDLRGLPATLGYSYGSTALMFVVPSLGIAEIFDGGNRDASTDLFESYIKESGKEVAKELLRVSPVDPVAGNPASIESQMSEGDFETGTSPTHDVAPAGKTFSLDARFGSYSIGDITQNVFTLPISYSYTFSNYDRLIIRAPITYIEMDGITAYRGNLGLAYRKNMFTEWAVTPALGYGITGSSSLGSVGQIFSGSVTSDLTLHQSERLRISMGNMIGYYATLPVDFGDNSIDYSLKNTIARNGLLFSMPLQTRFWNRAFTVDIFITDTSFFGDALYSNNYQELGISIGPARSAAKLEANQSGHPFGLGMKYLSGDGGIEGLEFNFGYRF
jgi:hypothetical protein